MGLASVGVALDKAAQAQAGSNDGMDECERYALRYKSKVEEEEGINTYGSRAEQLDRRVVLSRALFAASVRSCAEGEGQH